MREAAVLLNLFPPQERGFFLPLNAAAARRNEKWYARRI